MLDCDFTLNVSLHSNFVKTFVISIIFVSVNGNSSFVISPLISFVSFAVLDPSLLLVQVAICVFGLQGLVSFSINSPLVGRFLNVSVGINVEMGVGGKRFIIEHTNCRFGLLGM